MRAAFFDLDETLLDRTGSLRQFVTWQAWEMLGANTVDPALFIERFIELDQQGRVWKDKVYESLTNEFSITSRSVDELLDSYLLRFCEFCAAKNGALESVEAFRRQGFKIGLVSNGESPFQERNFEALGFSSLFDCVIVSDAVGLRKPDKAIFELACYTVDVDISDSIFIGDNPIADVQGAKNAGLSTIYVPVADNGEACQYADHTFNDLFEVARHVEENALYARSSQS